MNKSDLARCQGYLVKWSKLIDRGMPTDGLEAATEWRRQNLDITQTKHWRIDGNEGVKRQLIQHSKNMDVDSELDRLVTMPNTRSL